MISSCSKILPSQSRSLKERLQSFRNPSPHIEPHTFFEGLLAFNPMSFWVQKQRPFVHQLLPLFHGCSVCFLSQSNTLSLPFSTLGMQSFLGRFFLFSCQDARSKIKSERIYPTESCKWRELCWLAPTHNGENSGHVKCKIWLNRARWLHLFAVSKEITLCAWCIRTSKCGQMNIW